MQNCIFRYNLLDAWGRDISEIKIYDNETNNVSCMNVNNKKMASANYTVSKENIEKIKSLLCNDKLSELNELESPMVLDGVINRFEFEVNDKNKVISGFNLWGFEKDSFKYAPNAKILYKVFNNIKNICIENGVPKIYFNLGG